MAEPVPAPHHGVLTRLGVSPIHGVGVFAVEAIVTGADPFPGDTRDLVWVDAAVVDDLPAGSPQRRLYEDFGVRQGDRIGCPPSFDLLGPGWFVNEPATGAAPNLVATEAAGMLAARDIAPGEELTIVYATFSEPSPVMEPDPR